ALGRSGLPRPAHQLAARRLLPAQRRGARPPILPARPAAARRDGHHRHGQREPPGAGDPPDDRREPDPVHDPPPGVRAARRLALGRRGRARRRQGAGDDGARLLARRRAAGARPGVLRAGPVSAPGALRALDHAIVLVEDLERAAADQARLLGRAPSWRGAHPELGTENALFRVGDVYLELLAPTGRRGLAQALRARLEAGGEGPLGLAFATDDADRCAAALRARGLAAADPVPGEGHELGSGAVRRWRRVMLPADAARGVVVF